MLSVFGTAERSHSTDKFGFCTNLGSAKTRRPPPFMVPDDRSLWKVVISRTAWRALQESNLWPQD